MSKWGEFEFNPPYDGKEIEKVNNVGLPKQYIDFMKMHNGGEGDIGETWFVLYPLEDLQSINDDYETEKYLPNHIIIGSNGGGELYGIDTNGNYFNVPDIIEKEYLTLFGDDIDSLPDKINEFWK